jgi:hypothetical protein
LSLTVNQKTNAWLITVSGRPLLTKYSRRCSDPNHCGHFCCSHRVPDLQTKHAPRRCIPDHSQHARESGRATCRCLQRRGFERLKAAAAWDRPVWSRGRQVQTWPRWPSVPATALNRATPEIARRELRKLAQNCNRPSGQRERDVRGLPSCGRLASSGFSCRVNFGPHMKLRIFVFFKFYGLNPRKNPDPSRPLGAGQPAAPFAGDHRTPEPPAPN